ncbi:MAG: hypothetical protein AAGU75_16580, partial [Bacillota bacterium]
NHQHPALETRLAAGQNGVLRLAALEVCITGNEYLSLIANMITLNNWLLDTADVKSKSKKSIGFQ